MESKFLAVQHEVAIFTERGIEMKTVAVSGYFDPVHKGHLELFKKARQLGDELVVIVNNDQQTIGKKGYIFMPAADRAELIASFDCVSKVVIATDKDGTVCETLRSVHPDIFANGGDRVETNTPEKQVCDELGIEMVYRVVGILGSSSSLVKDAHEALTKLQNITKRDWGFYQILSVGDGYKVKILEVLPNRSLSYQRHQHRDEYWIVINGNATVIFNGEEFREDNFYIQKNSWHQLKNESTDEILRVVEVAIGDYIEEDDIERKEI